jgi:hypothetical protein
MTWQELKEEAKKMETFFGASEDSICAGKLEFDKDGCIYLNPFYLDDEVDANFCIESDRTYDEMLAIMKALQ